MAAAASIGLSSPAIARGIMATLNGQREGAFFASGCGDAKSRGPSAAELGDIALAERVSRDARRGLWTRCCGS